MFPQLNGRWTDSQAHAHIRTDGYRHNDMDIIYNYTVTHAHTVRLD